METAIVNLSTGEILEEGVFKTHEQIKQQREHFKKQQEKDLEQLVINNTYKEYGNFTWFLYNVNTMLDIGIKPDELTKLIFISTYMDYENKLMFNKKIPMTKKNMNDLLNLSTGNYYEFYNTMINSKLFVYKKGYIYLNNNIFAKGDIKQTDIKTNKIRLYAEGIRSIYKQAKPAEHKSLSYIFQAIPFINIDYNTICHNPLQCDIGKIKPMLITDFSKIISYDTSQTCRLKTILKKIRLNGKIVFSFIVNDNGTFMYINPKVYYAGDKWDKVEILGEFCG